MEDTIIALLNNNLRVIIPDFGAFIIRQKQPRIIVFNEFLRYNDGILIDFIVKTEGIDRDIAEQRVLDFAEDGTKLLASGRELVIEGLGSLRKDSSGKINFTEAPEIIEIEKKGTVAPEISVVVDKKEDILPAIKPEDPQKPKSKSVAIKPKGKSAAAKPKAKSAAAKPKAKSAGVKKSKTVKTTSKASPVIETSFTEPVAVEPPAIELAIEPPAIELAVEPPAIESAIEPAAIEAVVEPAAIEAAVEPVAIEAAHEPAPTDFVKPVVETPPVRVPPQAENPSANTDRPAPVSTNRILAWILIILFVNACILSWFVFRKKTNEKSSGKSEITMITDTLSDRLADSVRAAALDSNIVYNDVPENEGNLITSSQAPGSRYYIVAGCFRDEVNADSLVTSLKLRGYNAAKFGKIGNLYAVCFASFDNKEEAVPELKKIREKVPSAWMTKF